MKDKKAKAIKTQEERAEIVMSIKKQFEDFGVNVDEFEPLEKLKMIMNEYQGEEVISGYSGKFFVPDFNRYVEYVLPIRKNTDGFVKLLAK